MATDIYALFREQAEANADEAFVRTLDGSVSYGEAAENVDAYAGAFSAYGLSDGDRLGIFLNNCPEFLYALLGAAKCGVPVAGINTGMRGSGLEHLVSHGDLTVLLSDDELLAHVENVETDADLLTTSQDSAYDHLPTLAAEATPLPDSERARPERTDLAVLLHTSGTTGLPKWCELSHRYFVELGSYVADRFEIAASDTVFNPLPLYHINPLGYYAFGGISAGATLGMVERFSVSRFWDQVRTLDATVVILHMAPKDMVLDRTTAEDARDHPIRVMFPADREFMRRYDIPKMLTGYGSTEAGGLTHTNKFSSVPAELPDTEDLSQYTGYPRRDVSYKIVNDRGEEVPRGTRGEILVRPEERGVIFSRYVDSGKTVEAWDGLWFNTGDFGYVDERNALHYTGRISDSISHKGEFVNVDLVETTLDGHPAVEQGVIVGVPDDVVGARVKAFVKRSADVSADELLADIEPELPTYMVPEFVEFVEEFPRLEGTEKIQRAKLRERGLDE